MENSNLHVGGFLFQGLFLPRSASNFIVRWNAPPQGFFKLNFEGSHLHNSAAGGFIIKDWTGNLLKARAALYGDSLILVAEARALRDGLHEAVKAGFKHLVGEGHNTTVT